jgi:hypothetical protein
LPSIARWRAYSQVRRRRHAVGIRRVLDREGLGVPWPGEALAIVAFGALFLVTALAAVALAHRCNVGLFHERVEQRRSRIGRIVVDDGWLALAILGVVGLAAIVSTLVSDPLATGAVLLLACLGCWWPTWQPAARR